MLYYVGVVLDEIQFHQVRKYSSKFIFISVESLQLCPPLGWLSEQGNKDYDVTYTSTKQLCRKSHSLKCGLSFKQSICNFDNDVMLLHDQIKMKAEIYRFILYLTFSGQGCQFDPLMTNINDHACDARHIMLSYRLDS